MHNYVCMYGHTYGKGERSINNNFVLAEIRQIYNKLQKMQFVFKEKSERIYEKNKGKVGRSGVKSDEVGGSVLYEVCFLFFVFETLART